MTVHRLREYRVKGEDRPLIGWVEVPCEPYRRKRWPGDSGYMTDVREVLRITPFGLHYYRENWQCYRDLYPNVEALQRRPERWNCIPASGIAGSSPLF